MPLGAESALAAAIAEAFAVRVSRQIEPAAGWRCSTGVCRRMRRSFATGRSSMRNRTGLMQARDGDAERSPETAWALVAPACRTCT
jgi:hypothetical protein